jgi:hypothetical protein
VRFIFDSFRTVRDVRRRATPGRGEFIVGAERRSHVLGGAVADGISAAAGRTLEARLKILQQGGDFGRLEHCRFDEQRRPGPRHEGGVGLDQALDGFAIASRAVSRRRCLGRR